MSISQYVIGGTALVAALAVGYAKWTEQGAKVKTSKAETAIARAECSTNAASDTTEALNQQITDLTREVERQKIIAAAEAKKSRQRLDAYNALARKINNVTENPPVPDAIELVLDRMRSAVPGAPGADRAHENGIEGEAADPRPNLPTGTDPAPEAPGS